MTYQTSQNLSWLYVNNTGLLSIVDTISVTPTGSVHFDYIVNAISNQQCVINLSLSSGTWNIPLTLIIPYLNIGPLLNTEQAVRTVISHLNQVSVVIQNADDLSGSTSVTSQTSNIQII